MSNNYIKVYNYYDRRYNYDERRYNYDERTNVNITSPINKNIINRSNNIKCIDHYNNINILLFKQRTKILLNIFNQNNKYLKNTCYNDINKVSCEYRL